MKADEKINFDEMEVEDVLKLIKVRNLKEMKMFKMPPPKLAMCMSAVLILKEKNDHHWPNAVKELSDYKFLESLMTIDKNCITQHVFL